MHAPTKHLEVTYGSFACRIEGFDDPLPVMREVVEYFHALAGHDRFMDMDPQAPDLDTLEELTADAAGGPVALSYDAENAQVSVLREMIAPYADDAEVVAEEEEETAAEDGYDEHVEEEEEEGSIFSEVFKAGHEVEEEEEESSVFASEESFEDDSEEMYEEEAEAEDEIIEEEDEESLDARLERIRSVVHEYRPESHFAAEPQQHARDDAEEDRPETGLNPLAARLADLARRKSELRIAATDAEGHEHGVMPAVGLHRPRSRGIETRPKSLPDTDAAVSRILSRTVDALEDPEVKRHRDAIGEMRAAVAATEADREMGTRESSRDLEDDIRDEMKSRDTEPLSRAAASPLRLVAAQRIEADDGSNRARLRRITSGHEGHIMTQEADFSEFAERHGAADLDEMIEAAAAFIVDIEGEEDFSRPQVMRKVESVIGDSFSREEGLRTFGRMLRMNQIVKLQNGRFQAHPESRYRG